MDRGSQFLSNDAQFAGKGLEAFNTVRGDNHIILNTHTAFARSVQPGLHRVHHAFRQFLMIAAHDLRCFVHIQTEAVPGLVHPERGELRVFQDQLYNVIDRVGCCAGPADVASLLIGGKDGFIKCSVVIGDFANKEGAGDVGIIALPTGTEVKQQGVARLYLIIRACRCMGLSRIVARSYDRLKSQTVGAMGKQLVHQDC